MLMALGQFVFGMHTLAYQELQRQTSWRHASNSRVGARPARQFLGPGDETIRLSGTLSHELMGNAVSLDQLREMGDSGMAWPLVAGTGEVFGAWVIESVNETGSYFLPNGTPRRIEFDMQLARVDDDKGGASIGVDETGSFIRAAP